MALYSGVALRKIDDETIARILTFANYQGGVAARKVALSLEQAIARMAQAGMTPPQIKTLLMNDLRSGGPIMGQISNGFLKITNGNVQYAAQQSMSEVYRVNMKEKQLYVWRLSPAADGVHCGDCEGRRTMAPMTMAEWRLVGVPGAGATVCGSNCYCELVPTEG